MRGRRKPKVKIPRAPRPRKITTEGKPRMYCPYQGDRTGIIIAEGPEQSVVYFDDDRSEEFLTREKCLPNTHFVRGVPGQRVKLKDKEGRVRLKNGASETRVPLEPKSERVMLAPAKKVKRSWSLEKFSSVVIERAKRKGVTLDKSMLKRAYDSGCSVADAVTQCRV